jgi:hypothetical protein
MHSNITPYEAAARSVVLQQRGDAAVQGTSHRFYGTHSSSSLCRANGQQVESMAAHSVGCSCGCSLSRMQLWLLFPSDAAVDAPSVGCSCGCSLRRMQLWRLGQSNHEIHVPGGFDHFRASQHQQFTDMCTGSEHYIICCSSPPTNHLWICALSHSIALGVTSSPVNEQRGTTG